MGCRKCRRPQCGPTCNKTSAEDVGVAKKHASKQASTQADTHPACNKTAAKDGGAAKKHANTQQTCKQTRKQARKTVVLPRNTLANRQTPKQTRKHARKQACPMDDVLIAKRSGSSWRNGRAIISHTKGLCVRKLLRLNANGFEASWLVSLP
eukprot:TRINITY_DN6345_c1_g1_i2.p1 TRINITY_DN6345_c1_g1~~TRINITY_DN6345_c1_g1_i2.p1  ORF type:complete len:152 (+),score=24.62 TRINITY_DN6345_c1_g1_i2:66-521(+)